MHKSVPRIADDDDPIKTIQSSTLDGADVARLLQAMDSSPTMGPRSHARSSVDSVGESHANKGPRLPAAQRQSPSAPKSRRASLLQLNLKQSTTVGESSQVMDYTQLIDRPWWNPKLRTIMPEEKWYLYFYYFTLGIAMLNAVVDPYKIGFGEPGGFDTQAEFTTILEYLGIILFAVDIVLKFFLAYEDPVDKFMVTDRRLIAINFSKKMLWFDLLFWFPFVGVINSAGGYCCKEALYIGLLGFLKLGRLYRIFDLFIMLDKKMVISQIALMLTRNFLYIMLTCHWFACIFYFMARTDDFSEQTWVGRNYFRFEGRGNLVAYIYALYTSVTAFAGLGDGDFYTANPAENIAMSLYLLFNIVLGAYILGTVTMLMVKGDERSKTFRDKITTLREYAHINELPEDLEKDMRQHMELSFQSEQCSDAQVLTQFPAAIKRRVMRHLYLEPLKACYMFKGCKARFFDALLAGCSIEVFAPGVKFLSSGDVVSDLYIMIEGEADVHQDVPGGRQSTAGTGGHSTGSMSRRASLTGPGSNRSSASGGSVAGSMSARSSAAAGKIDRTCTTSDCFGEVAFLTETPMMESVYTKTVVSILVIPRSAYTPLASEFKSQVHLVSQNISKRVQGVLMPQLQAALDMHERVPGSIHERIPPGFLDSFDNLTGCDLPDDIVTELAKWLPPDRMHTLEECREAYATVKNHRNKTERQRMFELLTAATRGDVDAVRTIVEAGCNPSSADYDGRTALMAACQHGKEPVMAYLLSKKAHHGGKDTLGRTALLYAVRGSHVEIIHRLVDAGATLAHSSDIIAEEVMEAVAEGDLALLARFLQAGTNPDLAGGHADHRTPLHAAAAQGSITAVKLLLEAGADVNAADQAGRLPVDEARRSRSMLVVDLLEPLTDKKTGGGSDTPKRSFLNGGAFSKELRSSIKGSTSAAAGGGPSPDAGAQSPTRLGSAASRGGLTPSGDEERRPLGAESSSRAVSFKRASDEADAAALSACE
ncbi:hypothetical protein FOA52_001574 [Chlamydomonas sp. UWO 241]|nr:hypothetical protein FOA52_001574 [Chlamydomonas sp. UWO 241]